MAKQLRDDRSEPVTIEDSHLADLNPRRRLQLGHVARRHGVPHGIAEILCVQEERVVGNDNCVRWHGLSLQIPAQRQRHHFVKVNVRVHAYADGRLAVFHGPRCLARYEPDGRLIEAPPATRDAA